MRFKKTAVTVIIILIALIINGSLPSCASSQEEAGITWLEYEDGITLAKEKNKKVFIDFHSDGCIFCVRMDDETYSDPNIADYLTQNFITIRIITDIRPEIAVRYNVEGLPSAWFLDENADKITKLPGFRSADALMPILKFINTDSYKSMSFKKFMEDYDEE